MWICGIMTNTCSSQLESEGGMVVRIVQLIRVSIHDKMVLRTRVQFML